MNKYFPSGKTTKIRKDITSFSQLESELIYEISKQLRELLQKCPHHGLSHWLIVQIFYNDLYFSTKTTIEAVAGDALMDKLPQEIQSLIKEMAANKRDNSRRQAGMIKMDTLNILSAQMNNVVKLLSKQAGVGPSSSFNVHVACCSICG